MNIQVLNNIINSKKWSRADLARMAHVSRAAVTKWFHQGEKSGWANVETNTLFQLAASLKIQPGLLLTKPVDWASIQTRFLWDRLYPDMESFLLALERERPQALARLVQVLGFREARQIIGKKAVVQFEKYKKQIKPARRNELEILWPLYNSQI